MPPEYLASPMVFVESWTDACTAMVELMKDPVALQARQRALVMWYDGFMRDFFAGLERDLEAKAEEGLGPACKS